MPAGANWSVVLEFVDHSQQLKDFVPKKKVKGRPPEEGLLSRCGLLLRRRRQLQGAISDAGVPRRSAVQLGADKPGDGEEDGLVAPQAGVVMEVPFLPRWGWLGPPAAIPCLPMHSRAGHSCAQADANVDPSCSPPQEA